MKRIKVINDPTDLATFLRALDTDTKRKVFQDVLNGWVKAEDIEKKYGKEGLDALAFFEKMKLVEISWAIDDKSAQRVKTYHSYYYSVHVNFSTSLLEFSDVLYAATMPEEMFRELEEKILADVGEDGIFSGDVAKKYEMSITLLKSLIKRSTKLEMRGHRIQRIKEL
ncbi:MAG: ArsR family transcriptional regulator [Thermoplasmata archaeon]|nr:ArsR family transcriptional regulator [Thermoplasmata archaeon]